MTRFAFAGTMELAAEDAAVLAARTGREGARGIDEVRERNAAEPHAEAVEHGAPRHPGGGQCAGAFWATHGSLVIISASC